MFLESTVFRLPLGSSASLGHPSIAYALVTGRFNPSRAVSILARDVERMGPASLKKTWMTARMRAAHNANPGLRMAFGGAAIHRAVTAKLERLFPDRFVSDRRAVFAGSKMRPEWFDTKTGRIIDLTTPREVVRHVRRCALLL